MKRFARNAVRAGAVSLALSGGSSLAASLDTDVSVSIPSVVSLYCYDQINLDMTGQIANGTLARPLNTSVTSTPGTWTIDGPLMGQNTTPPSIYAFLTLNGVCAFRGLSGDNGVNVSVMPLNTVLEGPDGSIIVMSSFGARVPDTSSAWLSSFDVPTAGYPFTDVRAIDVRMRMNIGSANVSGVYSSASDGTFMVTVIANP